MKPIFFSTLLSLLLISCKGNNAPFLKDDFSAYMGIDTSKIAEAAFKNNEGYVVSKIDLKDINALKKRYKFVGYQNATSKLKGHVSLKLFNTNDSTYGQLYYFQEKVRDQYDYFLIVVDTNGRKLHFSRYFEEPQAGFF